MYRAKDRKSQQMSMYDYMPPFHGELDPKNRWVRLAEDMDWDTFEELYSGNFVEGGKIAISARVALGVLVVKTLYNASDRNTVHLVRESPYMQYFIGMESFRSDVPFSAKSVERFRKRIPEDVVQSAVRLLKSYK